MTPDPKNTPSVARPLKKKPVDEWAETIIAFESPYQLKDMFAPTGLGELETVTKIEEQRFKIRLAHSDERAVTASMLVQKMYATRGYPANPVKRGAMRFTLMAYQGDKIVGTITLALDSEQGLLADQIYKTEVDRLRASGRRVGELTKLAIDRHAGSKHILAGLLHIAYIYAIRIYDYTDVVMEIVPRHMDYYVKMLGCEPWGEEKLNPRVNFPVSLLRLSRDYVDGMILKYGGKNAQGGDTRTLYPYFFSKADEDGIMQRLMRGD
jgi:hypothetical protein